MSSPRDTSGRPTRVSKIKKPEVPKEFIESIEPSSVPSEHLENVFNDQNLKRRKNQNE